MACYSCLIFLFLCSIEASLTHTQSSGFSVELIHHNSFKSPFYNPAETQLQRVSNAFHYSINRATYVYNFHFVSSTNMPEITVTPDRAGGYLISYSIGTPPFQLYGFLDTASDWVWFQCKPCEPCLNQTSPLFDPSKSSTYRNIPCSSPKCTYGKQYSCSTGSQKKCEYNYLYGDMSHSQGDLSIDTLTLNSTDGSSISFLRFVIGCGHSNSISYKGKGSGIVGFGNGASSLPSQLGSSIGGKFSYCFVPLYSEFNTSSKLNFGDKAVVSGPGTVSTPMFLRDRVEPFYLLNLEALSVEDKTIKFENSSSFIPGKPGNIVIDSGSTFTLLPDDVYHKLESAVASVIKLKRVKDPTQNLSLCYETTSKKLELPVITAHFTGADVRLNAVNTFIPVGNNVVCFAFATSPLGLPFFGNIAQQNFLVGFDRLKGTVSFKPMDCTKY